MIENRKSINQIVEEREVLNITEDLVGVDKDYPEKELVNSLNSQLTFLKEEINQKNHLIEKLQDALLQSSKSTPPTQIIPILIPIPTPIPIPVPMLLNPINEESIKIENTVINNELKKKEISEKISNDIVCIQKRNTKNTWINNVRNIMNINTEYNRMNIIEMDTFPHFY